MSPRSARSQPALRVAGVVALVVAGVLVLWRRFNVAPGEGAATHGDLTNYYFPMADRTAERLLAGDLPLWDPAACSGIPWLATMQVGVFYPGNWLALVLPAERALSVLMLLECVLAGVFAALLFRAWDRSGFACVAGGLLFVFGCVLGQTLWPPVVSTIVWLPWLVLCVERLVRTGGFRWWVGLAVGTALQILGGFPQYLVYSFLFLGPYAGVRLAGLWRSSGTPRSTAPARGLACAAAVVVGAGLAGAQLLPTLELLAQSERSGALEPWDVHYLHIPFPHTSAAVARNALDPSAKMITFDLGRGGGYLGVSTLVLLALGIAATARSGLTWFLLGAAAVSLVVSDGYFGRVPGLYPLVAELPLIGGFRTPERLRLITFFCVISIAVAGFDRLGRDEGARRRRHCQLVVIAASLAVTAGMAAVGTLPGAWRVGVTAALALALLQWPRSGGLRLGAQGALLALVVADVSLATRSVGPHERIPARLGRYYHIGLRYTVPATLIEQARARPGHDRMELVGFLPFVAARPSHGILRSSCYGPLLPRQWSELHHELTGAPFRGTVLVGIALEEAPVFYDLASVRHLVVKSRGRRTRPEIVENPDALPRAYVQDHYRVRDRDAIFGHIAAGDVDFRRVVLLDRAPGFPAAAEDAPLRPARIVEYAPEHVVVEAQSEGPALLVLTDSHYPGWEARVDGEPAPILLANGVYRAVRIERGSHRIEFTYRPSSLRWGAALSATSALVVVLAGASLRTIRRRGAREAPLPP